MPDNKRFFGVNFITESQCVGVQSNEKEFFYIPPERSYDCDAWSKTRIKSKLGEIGIRSVADMKIGNYNLNYGLHATYMNSLPKEISLNNAKKRNKKHIQILSWGLPRFSLMIR